MNVAAVFENELRRRGIALAIDAASGRQTIEIDGWSTLISLQNLQRDVDRDGDLGRVSRFVDSTRVCSISRLPKSNCCNAKWLTDGIGPGFAAQNTSHPARILMLPPALSRGRMRG